MVGNIGYRQAVSLVRFAGESRAKVLHFISACRTTAAMVSGLDSSFIGSGRRQGQKASQPETPFWPQALLGDRLLYTRFLVRHLPTAPDVQRGTLCVVCKLQIGNTH